MENRGYLEHQTTWWGVRPETLAVLAEQLTKPLSGTLAQAEDVSTTGGVAVLPLRGLITPKPSLLSLLFGGGGGLQAFRASLREAVASSDIGSILIDVDSPGGSTDLITETANEIRGLRGSKPIVAIANATAGSAAYWLASQADEVVVTPSGQVGSIGVFAIHMDESGMAEKLGLKPTIVSAGKYKTEGNPFEPLSEDAVKAAQETIDEFYGLFVGDVAAGRGVPVDSVRSGFGEGRMVTANRAVELGMADRVDSFEGTVARLTAAPSPQGTTAQTQTSENEEQQPDKPVSKEISEEGRARIAQLLSARRRH